MTESQVVSRRGARRRVPTAAREAFLEALAAGWSVTHAAERAETNRQRFYELRAADDAFAEEWDGAIELGTQMLEDELRRRALDGWDEETFNGEGKLVRRLRRYSPHDLVTLLKARRPEQYRDNVATAKVEISGRVELAADYRPTTLADVIAFAQLHRLDDVVDGEAVEADPELEPGS